MSQIFVTQDELHEAIKEELKKYGITDEKQNIHDVMQEKIEKYKEKKQ